MNELLIAGRDDLMEMQSPVSRGHILFMDDDTDIREVTQELLLQFGFTVALAKDGAEAISIYEQSIAGNNIFDVVILDLVVPRGLGAKDTITRLRKIHPPVKALVASGYSNDYILDNYKKFGFCGTLAKPYNFDELLDAIVRLISREGCHF